jgi:hypothetical protein
VSVEHHRVKTFVPPACLYESATRSTAVSELPCFNYCYHDGALGSNTANSVATVVCVRSRCTAIDKPKASDRRSAGACIAYGSLQRAYPLHASPVRLVACSVRYHSVAASLDRHFLPPRMPGRREGPCDTHAGDSKRNRFESRQQDRLSLATILNPQRSTFRVRLLQGKLWRLGRLSCCVFLVNLLTEALLACLRRLCKRTLRRLIACIANRLRWVGYAQKGSGVHHQG